MFLPRIVCGRNLGRDWESQKTNNAMQLKHINGASNFNSQLSNLNDVNGRSNGHRRLSHSNLARSRSIGGGIEGDSRRDVTFQTGFGNSLFPQRQSRLTASCVSYHRHYHFIKTHYVKIHSLPQKNTITIYVSKFSS